MLEPKRAPVRPRVISPVSGETLPLEDEILSLLERKWHGVVWLTGGPGSGKTTALAHLAAVLPPSAGVILRDETDPGPRSLRDSDLSPTLVVQCDREGTAAAKNAATVYRLAPWTVDEIVEYVLVAHQEKCRSIMRRYGPENDRPLLAGDPALCRSVIDVLADTDSIVTIKEALRIVIARRLPDVEVRAIASDLILGIFGSNIDLAIRSKVELEKICNEKLVTQFIFRPPIYRVLAADRISRELQPGGSCEILKAKLSQEIVVETASLIRHDAAAIDRLRVILTGGRYLGLQPMAASLVHAADVGWRPERQVVSGRRKWLRRQRIVIPDLHGACLHGACWPRVDLSKMNLHTSDLSDSDLSEANLDDVDATLAEFRRARLTGSSLARIRAEAASFAGADLSYIRAEDAQFQEIDARDAPFEGALLAGATFRGAKLARAAFLRANLKSACLIDADIEGADFSRADFSDAWLNGLALKLADFSQCSFSKAQLFGCDLEGMDLPGVDFSGACLAGALLTGTNMPGANFRAANLVNTGLADIDWEQADLREAVLLGASFHLGSSRSGLVDSPIASLGTRTGFYTDDFNEQDFKSPEEIRKANLRGADLRGANISGVDFYLVDLRDALYDPRQEEHFRACGAILETRAI